MAYPSGTAWKHTGPALGMQAIEETSATQQHRLGLEVSAYDTTYGAGLFIYLLGVASTAAGDLCFYLSTTGATVRSLHGGTGSNGPACVAMSANVAGGYGWYQVIGAGPVKSATVSTNTALYLTATAGQIDDLAVSGDLVDGLTAKAASSGGFTTCQLNRPNMTGLGGASGTNTGDVTLGAIGAAPNANSATLAAQVLNLEPASASFGGIVTTGTQSLAGLKTFTTGIAGLTDTFLYCTLSAAAEAGDAIVVTGQVKNLQGTNVAIATEVVLRTLAVTADKGDITVTTGTSNKVVNPAVGENVAWITSDAAGAFVVSIANTAAEITLVYATPDNGLEQMLKLTFT